VKRNVTVLSHLVLADFHLGQKGWAQNILFLIILYVCKHQLVEPWRSSEVGIYYIRNKHKEGDVSLTDDDQVAL
jgi:hypothetical protein